MADRDLVLGRVATIKRCLARIETVTELDPDRLRDLDAADVFVLNVQRASQACIDIAQHLTASEGLGPSQTLAEAFDLLALHAELDDDLARAMRSMVGFRNVVVHQNQELDPSVLHAILVDHLDDFRSFCRYAVGFLDDAQGDGA